MNQLTLDKFEEAYERVQEVVLPTNLIQSDFFSQTTGNKVYLKPENLQLTGAYKIRGAYYKISTMSDEEKQKGLITASAGNHAQGVAYAARKFGVPATIVMPVSTPLLKVNRTKSLGAKVILHGNVYDEACDKALELAAEHGYTFVHPFDDLDVATGQGSIAMEIIKELPTVDTILVPVGGGGLATGVSTLAKMLNPKIHVIGVEPAGANCLQVSLREGRVTTLDKVDTIADGTAVKTPGENIFPYLQENLDDIITIEDDELIVAFLDVLENHKLLVENSGLLTVAALKHLLQNLYGFRASAGCAGTAQQSIQGHRRRQRQRHQTGAQPVYQRQPKQLRGTDHHHGGLRRRSQAEHHPGTAGRRLRAGREKSAGVVLERHCIRVVSIRTV